MIAISLATLPIPVMLLSYRAFLTASALITPTYLQPDHHKMDRIMGNRCSDKSRPHRTRRVVRITSTPPPPPLHRFVPIKNASPVDAIPTRQPRRHVLTVAKKTKCWRESEGIENQRRGGRGELRFPFYQGKNARRFTRIVDSRTWNIVDRCIYV